MKKHVIILSLAVLTAPATVFAPAIGGQPQNQNQNQNGDVQPTIVYTPATAVAAYPNDLADVLAGGIAAGNVMPNPSPDVTSPAYKAGQSAVTGTAVPNPSYTGSKSKALGRLGVRKK